MSIRDLKLFVRQAITHFLYYFKRIIKRKEIFFSFLVNQLKLRSIVVFERLLNSHKCFVEKYNTIQYRSNKYHYSTWFLLWLKTKTRWCIKYYSRLQYKKVWKMLSLLCTKSPIYEISHIIRLVVITLKKLIYTLQWHAISSAPEIKKQRGLLGNVTKATLGYLCLFKLYLSKFFEVEQTA